MYRKYLKLKGCPRCHGDLLIDRAYEEFAEVCIQCGFRKYNNIINDPPKPKRRRRRKVKQAASA